MSTAEDRTQNTQANDLSLMTLFNQETELFELHTHLLGMGNTEFWINHILENPNIMPTNNEFHKNNLRLREKLCRLVWNESKKEFVNGNMVALIIQYLIEENYPDCSFSELEKKINFFLLEENTVLHSLAKKNTKFERELRHRGLTFGMNFSYDVILKLTDLADGLGVKQKSIDLIQTVVEEILGFHTSPPFVQSRTVRKKSEFARRACTSEEAPVMNSAKRQKTDSNSPMRNRKRREDTKAKNESSAILLCDLKEKRKNEPLFRHWIIFNARDQCFEVAYGMTVEQLRNLISIDADQPRETKKLARAYIKNAFSMCDAQGTTARQIDFHGFHGAFTPEFYPRRFALKDSIYSQRLDVLAHLLYYVLLRYQSCTPPVTYCELSVGVGDLTRPWVFDVLCSFHTLNQTLLEAPIQPSQTTANCEKIESGFRKLLILGHFPELKNAVIEIEDHRKKAPHYTPQCTYKFLAGFKRQNVQSPLYKNQLDALNLLNEAPQLAIYLMLNEISKSDAGEAVTEDNIFYLHIQDLEKIKNSAKKNPSFNDWVVGLDLFGDEIGFPYCPFVARPFIDYVKERRENGPKQNPSFGLRIHCGENVPFADADSSSYRHFAAHMYIVFRCLRYLQHKLKYGIRIGHGIAFQRILDGSMSPSKHRKSSVLLAEIKDHARFVLTKIAFEVNITSNEYLLGHALRRGNYQRPLQLKTLFDLGAPVILATDDDGIWPIDNCPSNHPGHYSLPAEYCRAISSKIIQNVDELKKIISNTKMFRFYSDEQVLGRSEVEESLPKDVGAFTVVMHPDVIKLIVNRCHRFEQTNGIFYRDFSKAYPPKKRVKKGLNDWEKTCLCLAPVAYISYCVKNSKIISDDTRQEYLIIFEDGPNLDALHTEWQSVYQQLIEPNIINQSQCVATHSGEDIFFSEGPLTPCIDSERPMKDLIDYLQRHYHKDIRVHAFSRHVNIPVTVNEIQKQLKRDCHINLRVYIYSNKDKDKYEDFDLTHKLQLEINHTPSKRTDHEKKDQQNALYAVCPHASAATAFLHFIAHELQPNNDSQPVAVLQDEKLSHQAGHLGNVNMTSEVIIHDDSLSANTS